MENKISEEQIVSTQKHLDSSHDPGWNDPPKWAFSPAPNASSSGTPTRRLLNKRVAFPLNSTCLSGNKPAQSTNLPPLPSSINIKTTTAPHAPLFSPTTVYTVENSSSSSNKIIDKDQALNDTFENLNYIINDVLKNDDKIDEIQKRLGIMKSMWNDNKLNNEIHEKVYELSQALRLNDIDTADKIHMLLMMNHGTLCNTWISAIRHLILIIKRKINEEKIETKGEISDKSEPLLLMNHTESN
ncbi:hypothetical protein PV325_000268 [Microctonus aethiopoides]|nr:hypothetical protein PV325_000268 [Microctonus aethiopoides]